jgi:hypothetical protein
MTARSSRTPGSEDAASDRPRRRGPRWVGWLLRALLILIALIAIAWVALQQQPISTALARAVFARIHVVRARC